jgi:hypothetical protein
MIALVCLSLPLLGCRVDVSQPAPRVVTVRTDDTPGRAEPMRREFVTLRGAPEPGFEILGNISVHTYREMDDPIDVLKRSAADMGGDTIFDFHEVANGYETIAWGLVARQRGRL